MAEAPFQPDWFSKPGDTLLALMEQREITSEALSQRMGYNASVVQGVLNGSTAIDDNLAKALARVVGGTADFWKVRQERYQLALSRVAESIPAASGNEWVRRFP